MIENFGIFGIAHRGKAQQPGLVTVFLRRRDLLKRLIGAAADTGNFCKIARIVLQSLINRRRCKFEHRFEKAVLRFANLELGRMNSYRKSAGSSVDVVAGERLLMFLRQLPVLIESERLSGNDMSLLKKITKIGHKKTS